MQHSVSNPGPPNSASAPGTAPRRVLIAEDDPVSARLIKQAFSVAGYAVEVVTDGKTAYERIEAGGLTAVLSDWMIPELDGIELVHKVRKLHNSPYYALVTAIGGPEAKAHALRAGCDDMFQKPVNLQNLVSHVETGIERRQRAASKGGGGQAKEHPVARSKTWGNLLETARIVLSGTTGLPLVHAAAPEDGLLTGIRCKLPLIDTEHLMELHVEVAAEQASAVAIAGAMFGDPPPESLAELTDMLGEFANTIAGSLRASFVKEGLPFTMGLAKQSKDVDVSDYDLTVATSLRAESSRLTLRFGVRPRNCVRISATDLKEGMVLAENVYNGAGALILPGGNRLTATATDKLQRMLNGRSVKVCVPDA